MAPAAGQRRRPPVDRHGLRRPAVPGADQLDSPAAFTADLLFGDLWIALFVALFLSFVTGGRLTSTLDVILVGAFVVDLLVLPFARLLYLPVEDNLLLVSPNAGTASALLKAPSGAWSRRGARRRGRDRRALAVGVAPAPARAAPSLWGASAPCCTPWRSRASSLGSPIDALKWPLNAALVTVPAALAWGLLRSRLARGGLADLFRELGTLRGVRLEAGLARVLGDPGLVLAYRVPGERSYLDGRRTAGGAARAGRRPGGRAGRARRARARDARLRPVARRRSGARRRPSRPRPRSRSTTRGCRRSPATRLAELRASRERLVAAGDAERRRLERNLHDGAQQRLVSVALQLRMIRARVQSDPAAAEALTVGGRRALAVAGGAARARARDPSRGPQPRPQGRARFAGVARERRDRRSPSRALSACPNRWSWRRTSSPPRRWPTSPSTPTRRRRRCGSPPERHRGDRDRRRRRRRRRRDGRHRPPRPGGPGRRARRHAAHPQPARRRDGGHRGAAVRVVIADDSRLVREGIASFLRGEGIEVVGQAEDPEELLAAVDEHEPDVAIVDIRMPPTQTDEGVQAAHEIRRRHPGMGIVLLSQHVEVGVATPAAGRGAAAPRLPPQGPRDGSRGLRRLAASASRTAAPPSIRRSSPRLLAIRAGRPARSRCRRASARCSSSSPRAAPTRRSPSAWSSPRAPCRST